MKEDSLFLSTDQVREMSRNIRDRMCDEGARNDALPPYQYTVPHMMIYETAGEWWRIESLCFHEMGMVGVRVDYVAQDYADRHPLVIFLKQIRKESEPEKKSFFSKPDRKKWKTYFNFLNEDNLKLGDYDESAS